MKTHGFLEDDIKVGTWTYYYVNGHRFKEITYENGIENGPWTMWHENGNLYIERFQDRGRTVGIWKEYYENGSLKEVREYRNGEYFPSDFWNESGDQLLLNGNGKKIESFGAGSLDVFEHYFIDGKLIKELRL
ncbi:MAG: hypothetical protein EOO19_00565 [Chryseobacterium sp.]|nr:MAG: hypothetical protein EOO19_00565 [Chryseobacterium sp.]